MRRDQSAVTAAIHPIWKRSRTVSLFFVVFQGHSRASHTLDPHYTTVSPSLHSLNNSVMRRVFHSSIDKEVEGERQGELIEMQHSWTVGRPIYIWGIWPWAGARKEAVRKHQKVCAAVPTFLSTRKEISQLVK